MVSGPGQVGDLARDNLDGMLAGSDRCALKSIWTLWYRLPLQVNAVLRAITTALRMRERLGQLMVIEMLARG
jgi:hypothetical protein